MTAIPQGDAAPTRRLIVLAITESVGARGRDYLRETVKRLRPYADLLALVTRRGERQEPRAWARISRSADVQWSAPRLDGLHDALRTVVERLGIDAVSAFDEVVVCDDTLVGPIGGPAEWPEPADCAVLDGWLLVEPDRGSGPERLEVPWLVLRGKSVAQSGRILGELAAHSGMNELASELRAGGLRIGTVHPPHGRDIFLLRDSLSRLLTEHIQFLPWGVLTADPLVCDRWGIVPRDAYDSVIERGYPAAAIWDHLLQNCQPRTWYTNLAMAEILPEGGPAVTTDLVTAVIMHVFYVDMLSELADRAALIPGEVRLIITTDTPEKQQVIRDELGRNEKFESVEVRVVTSNRGRDISAFLIDCDDVLRDESIDIIVKLHSKRSLQDPESVSGWFRRHLLDNLLADAGYASRIYERFRDEPDLGIVFPPTIHMGLPTMGHAWGDNAEPAREVAARVGITTPFDESTPLAPYGSMFIARRSAIAPLLQGAFVVEEFPDSSDYKDGSLAHVLERLIGYIAFSRGFYAKTVQTTSLASISSVNMDYKLQAVGKYLPPHALQQVAALNGTGEIWPIRVAAGRHLRRILRGRSALLERLATTLWRQIRKARNLR